MNKFESAQDILIAHITANTERLEKQHQEDVKKIEITKSLITALCKLYEL